MMNINLYLGAHKTATTHLQGILLANRARLESAGVKLSAPVDVRKVWLPAYFKYCNNRKAADAQLIADIKSIAPADGTWILTEENIVGVSNDFMVRPGIYPLAARRLRGIAELFAGVPMKLFFSIRSYDGFYRSAYSEVVRNRGYVPFSDFYQEERFQDNSWVDTVHAFQSVLPQASIYLWKFEDFRALVPTLVRLMTGFEDVGELLAAYSPETTRPSLSQKTMQILDDLGPVLSRQESLALVERINRAYPVGERHAAYQPFSDVQVKRFKEQYAADVEKIKATYPEIRFIEPGQEAKWA